jgi:RNA polymerase sigma factor (sigma-70 family)
MHFTDLVTRAQGGDEDAYAELIARFQGMAFAYAFAALGDFHMAQDAAQEAFTEAHRAIRHMRIPAAFPTFLRRIVHKHCDRLTRRKQLLRADPDVLEAVADGSLSPADGMVAEELRAHVRIALSSLPAPERAVTIFSYIHDYSQGEVAAFLDISVDTVKNRLRSARRKLTERMVAMAQQVLQEETPDVRRRLDDAKELIRAAREGDAVTGANLIQQYPEMLDGPAWDLAHSYPDHPGWSPLYTAAMHGHAGIAKYLLDLGANPIPFEVSGRYHDENYLGWLGVVRERGHGAVVEALQDAIALRYGPLVDADDLHQAARDGDTERVQALVDQDPERVKHADAIGCTALHWAVEGNHLGSVRALVEAGARVDARRGDGRTPALVAVFGFHRYWRREDKPEILRYLLDAGAEYTLLIAAAIGDAERVNELLRADPTSANALDPVGRRPLSGAVESGNAAIVRRLLTSHADPNARELLCGGGLALRTACVAGATDMVELLLDYGANPELSMDSCGACIEAAIDHGHARITSLLYAHGTTCGIRMYAMQHRIDVVAEMLKIDPSRADDVLPGAWKGAHNEDAAYDIMRLATRYGARFESAGSWELRWTLTKYPKVFRLLVEYGADPNQPLLGIAGDMPRRYEGQERMVQLIGTLLEEFGADANCHDEEGLTPLALASREGHALIADCLLSHGAATHTDAPDWAQPAALAASNGHENLARRLRREASPGGD